MTTTGRSSGGPGPAASGQTASSAAEFPDAGAPSSYVGEGRRKLMDYDD